MAINDTIILDSKKHGVTGINCLVACVACFMIMSAHCGSECRQAALARVEVCVHVSINQGMFIHNSMCVPDSIK